MTDDQILSEILRREGGFVDHPADKGGPTNFGITSRSLSKWRKRAVTTEEIRHLTEAEARAIYQAEYLEPWVWMTDQRVRVFLIDYGVHAGVRGAVTALQHVLRSLGHPVDVDGVAGSQTRTAADVAHPVVLFEALVAHRLIALTEQAMREPRMRALLASGTPLQAAFLLGWVRRVVAFLQPEVV